MPNDFAEPSEQSDDLTAVHRNAATLRIGFGGVINLANRDSTASSRAEYFFLFLIVSHNKLRSLPIVVREIERTTVLVVHWDSTAMRVNSGTFFPVRSCNAPLLQVIRYVIRVRSLDSRRKSISRVTATALPTDMV